MKTLFWAGLFTLTYYKSKSRLNCDNLMNSSRFYGSIALPNLTKPSLVHSFQRDLQQSKWLQSVWRHFNTWTSSGFFTLSFTVFEPETLCLMKLMMRFEYSLHHQLSTIPAQTLKRSYPARVLERIKAIKTKENLNISIRIYNTMSNCEG